MTGILTRGMTSLALASAALSQQGGTAPGYQLVPEWPKQARSVAGTPAGPWNFGQVVAVATTSRGHILVLHRGAHPIMEFDPDGNFIRSWGNDLFSEGRVVRIAPADRLAGGSGYSVVYGPAGCYACGVHSVRVDREGNIWVVDAGAHVVYKMNQEGKVILRLGRKGTSGTANDQFNLPTDVAFSPQGEIYVSDGYGNPRIVKYSREGKYLLQWGKRGSGPGQFELPHNLVVDAQGRVYVTDRDNRRIQIFDANGEFLRQWENVGAISTLFMTKEQLIWAGGVLRDLDGKVLTQLPEAEGGHGTTVTDSGDVYIAQLSGKVQKFVRNR